MMAWDFLGAPLVNNPLPFYTLKDMGQRFRACFQVGTIVAPNKPCDMATSTKKVKKTPLKRNHRSCCSIPLSERLSSKNRQKYSLNVLFFLRNSVTIIGPKKSHPVAWKARSPEISLSLGTAAINWELDFAFRNWQNVQFFKDFHTDACPRMIQKRSCILASTNDQPKWSSS